MSMLSLRKDSNNYARYWIFTVIFSRSHAHLSIGVVEIIGNGNQF